jgi:hypothetical protein
VAWGMRELLSFVKKVKWATSIAFETPALTLYKYSLKVTGIFE